MSPFSYVDVFRLAVPESVLVIGALFVLFLDLVQLREHSADFRSAFLAGTTAVFCTVGIAWLQVIPQTGSLPDGMLVMNPTTTLVKQCLLGLTALTALISWRTPFTRHIGEYFALLLLATVGMLFLASAQHLLMIFVALELFSLSLYVLVAFNKESRHSAEAALKYFLFGGMAAAFTLFGLSLVYGLTGQLSLAGIAKAMADRPPELLLHVALVMTLVGFGFKIAVAPFHLWAPDAYQGAPTPAAAFIASGSKVASFYVLANVLMLGFGAQAGDAGWGHFQSGWQPVIAIFATMSMVIGNLVALNQTSVKRLLAYSAIAHAGYALVGVLANSPEGLSSVVFYSVTYALATLGAFAVVYVVEQNSGTDDLDAFLGLKQHSPALAVSLMIFLLSSAGIPPLAGFFGKFYVFVAGVKSGSADLGLVWLVALALVMSAVSLYYYLQVLKRALVKEAASSATKFTVSPTVVVVIALMAAAVVALGCLPTLLIPAVASSAAVVPH